MKTLKNTHKSITLTSVTKEIDFTAPCEIHKFTEFAEWVQIHNSTNATLSIRQDSMFWNSWLQNEPDVQVWLVEKDFATWDKPKQEIEYSLDGRPGTVKLALTTSGGGQLRLTAGEYTLMNFKNGVYRRAQNVYDVAKTVGDRHKIKEVDDLDKGV